MHICYFLTGIPHGNFLLSIFFLKSRFSCPVHPGISYLPAIPCLSGISNHPGAPVFPVFPVSPENPEFPE